MSLVLIVAVATLALSLTVVWRTVQGQSSPFAPFVGSWRFISGEIKVGGGFPVSNKQAPAGTTTRPLAGTLAVVEVHDGVLWCRGAERSCWHELRVGGGKAEVVPGGKVECDTEAPDAPKRATSVRMSMEIDSRDRAHISGEGQTSVEFKSERHNVTFAYDGIAVRDTPPAK